MDLSKGEMNQAEQYTLSDDDIRQLLGGQIKITPYPDLAQVRHISELFDGRGRSIIFFPQDSLQSGHWTAMIKNGREIEFFDPYGEPPDAQKDGLSKSKLEQLRMNRPLLSDLLENSGHRIIFNKVQLQELADDVNTCGRHCVARLLYSKHPIQRYRQMISKTGMTPDQFVIAATYRDLGK
jgi:hypothetical protein